MEIDDERGTEIEQYIYSALDDALMKTVEGLFLNDDYATRNPASFGPSCDKCGHGSLLISMLPQVHGFNEVDSSDMLLAVTVMSFGLLKTFLSALPDRIEDPDGKGAIYPVTADDGWESSVEYTQCGLGAGDATELIDFVFNSGPEPAINYLHMLLHTLVATTAVHAAAGVQIWPDIED